jgi:hypothetical protein
MRLGHAVSVHKAQGSQAPAVVVVLHRGHQLMLTRNLLYTAITRAERVCVVVGEPAALHAALGRRDAHTRHTRVAELLAAGGAQVELVARRGTAGASLGLAIGYVVGRLLAAGVVMHDGCMATAIGDGSVELLHALRREQRTIEGVDHVVVATMREPVVELQGALEDAVPYLYVVGDALAPRNLRVATYEGHRFGRVIGEPGAPKTTSEELFRVNDWHQVPAA